MLMIVSYELIIYLFRFNIKMGNCIGNSNTRIVKTITNNKTNVIKYKMVSSRKHPLKHISKSNWLNVLDYLQFNELREVGKVNKQFNKQVKNAKILIKFFKKKKYSNDNSVNASSNCLATTNGDINSLVSFAFHSVTA